jgi:hypothetical protein
VKKQLEGKDREKLGQAESEKEKSVRILKKVVPVVVETAETPVKKRKVSPKKSQLWSRRDSASEESRKK